MGQNEVHALRGVDLTVESGEMIAVMGASGSGKSTLMNILGCLDVPTGGDYLLDGVHVNGLEATTLADLAIRSSASCSRASTCSRARPRSRTSSCRCSTIARGRRLDTRALAAEALDARRARRAARPSAERALRRTAAARRHRPRARDAAGAAARRRADRQSRQPHVDRDHGAVPGAERPGHHDPLVTHEPDIAQLRAAHRGGARRPHHPRRSRCRTAAAPPTTCEHSMPSDETAS